MDNELKIGWSEQILCIIIFLIPVVAIVLSTLFFTDKLGAHHLWSTALFFLGLTALNGKIWSRMGRAFRKYDERIKMMPHM